MKKSFIKTIAVAVLLALTFSFTACTTYRENGSEIQDVKFNVSYTVDGETKTINSTLSLYKTFAPKTCDRVIELCNNGFYNDSSLVLSKQQDYVVVGGFEYKNDGYSVKAFSGDNLEGEFTKAGRESKLSVKPGALVMIREFDSKAGGQKYDTAKASFAIVLTDAKTFTSDKFCVFGYIDDESVELLKDAFVDYTQDDKGYFHAKYMGDRVDGALDTATGFDYYFNADKEYYHASANGVGDKMQYDSDTDEDYDKYETIIADNKQDVFILPDVVFSVKTELCKGKNK